MIQSALKETISGHWRIIWMEMWDQDYVDLVAPGYIKIDRGGRGSFQFGVVTGGFLTDPVHTYFDSKWEGSSEGDEERGEIYGTFSEDEEQEGNLCGTISFWSGDESEYKAVRVSLNNK